MSLCECLVGERGVAAIAPAIGIHSYKPSLFLLVLLRSAIGQGPII